MESGNLKFATTFVVNDNADGYKEAVLTGIILFTTDKSKKEAIDSAKKQFDVELVIEGEDLYDCLYNVLLSAARFTADGNGNPFEVLMSNLDRMMDGVAKQANGIFAEAGIEYRANTLKNSIEMLSGIMRNSEIETIEPTDQDEVDNITDELPDDAYPPSIN